MQFDRLKRREFIKRLCGALASWPLAAHAQQSAIPMIGWLSSVPFGTRRDQVLGFHRGLKESGYVEGQNVTIEYRSADNQIDRLRALAADLVNRRVDVIVTIGGDNSIQAAKGATTTIPVVFVTGFDPVAAGFVASLNRPGGNLTGVSFLVVFTVAKRLELLSELVPTAGIIGMLVNPNNPNAESTIRDAQAAAEKLGKKLVVVEAGTESDLDTSFATFIRQKVEAVLVETDPFFLAQREQIVVLTARHSLPAIFAFREFVAVGGLMSYGTSLSNAYHQAGVYAGKILKGEKPTELPVVQPTKFEFVINLKTAKTLGLRISDNLLSLADEVIE
jgi:putative tryptophan/tyrosine transport system substrate-binding protein